MTLQATDETGAEIEPIVKAHIGQTAHLITDGHGAYAAIKEFVRHSTVNHEVEYVSTTDPNVHTQTIESHWAILKREMVGTFHHVNRGYLPMYLSEFQYRWNSRRTSDSDRFAVLLTQVGGRLAWRAKPKPSA